MAASFNSHQTTIEDLFDEILLKIFAQLPISDRFRITGVCSRFYSLIHSIPVHVLQVSHVSFPLEQVQPFCTDSDHFPDDVHVVRYSKATQLQSLTRSLLPCISRSLSTLILNIPSLEHLLCSPKLLPQTKNFTLVSSCADNTCSACVAKANPKRSRVYKLLASPFNHHTCKHRTNRPSLTLSTPFGESYFTQVARILRLEHFELHLLRLHDTQPLLQPHPAHLVGWFAQLLGSLGQTLIHLRLYTGAKTISHAFADSHSNCILLSAQTPLHSSISASSLDSLNEHLSASSSSSSSLSSTSSIHDLLTGKPQISCAPRRASHSPSLHVRVTDAQNTRPAHPHAPRSSSFFGRIALDQLHELCPHLKRLHFEPLVQVIESLHPIQLPGTLNALCLPHVRLMAAELARLLAHSRQPLQELALFDLNASLLSMLCSASSACLLTTLRLGKVRVAQPTQLLCLTQLYNLRVLNVCLHYKNVDDVLPQIAAAMPQLREFSLTNAQISVNGLAQTLINWPDLQHLEIRASANASWCSRLCLDAIRPLTKLQRLALPYVRWHSQAIDELLRWLGEGRLHALDVSYGQLIPLEQTLQAAVQGAHTLASTNKHLHLALAGLGAIQATCTHWPDNLHVLADA